MLDVALYSPISLLGSEFECYAVFVAAVVLSGPEAVPTVSPGLEKVIETLIEADFRFSQVRNTDKILGVI